MSATGARTIEERLADLECYIPLLARIQAYEADTEESLPEILHRIDRLYGVLGDLAEALPGHRPCPAHAVYQRPYEEPMGKDAAAMRKALAS